MATALDKLEAAIANISTVVAGAVTLLNQLNATVQAGNPVDAAQLQRDVDALNAQAATLGATVTADTPAAAVVEQAP